MTRFVEFFAYILNWTGVQFAHLTEIHLVSVLWSVFQRERWLKNRVSEKCVSETRNFHVLFCLVWVHFVHERFESGFRDLTLCFKVLR